MKKSNLLLLAVAALGLGFTAVTTVTTETAHAAYYKWTKTKNYSPSVAMKQKNPGTTAYMWNAHHTAKLHNLKNYPRTTWYLSKSVKMTRGSKSAIYYRVTRSNGKVNGYVWRGYLTQGTNTNAGSTTGTGASTQNSNSSTNIPTTDASLIDNALSAQLISMFPGTVQDSKLQSLANAYPSDKLSTSAYSSLVDSSSYDKLLQTTLVSGYRNLVKIGPASTGDKVEPRASFIAGKISFSDYIKQGSAIYDGFNQTNQKFTFTQYQGYHIGAWVSPKGITSDPMKGTKGYGDFVVLLQKQ